MKNNLPSELENIISLFKELPGIGQRGAERMVFSILKWPPEKIKVLGNAIFGIPEKIKKFPDLLIGGRTTNRGENH